MNLKSKVFVATFSTLVISLMTSYGNADSDLAKQSNADNKAKIKFFKMRCESPPWTKWEPR